MVEASSDFSWSVFSAPPCFLPGQALMPLALTGILGASAASRSTGGSWCEPCRQFLPELWAYSAPRSAQQALGRRLLRQRPGRVRRLPRRDALSSAASESRDTRPSCRRCTGCLASRLIVLGRTGSVVTLKGRSCMHQIFDAAYSAKRDSPTSRLRSAYNRLRAVHGAPPLEWSDHCADQALIAAKACKAKNTMFHNNCKEPRAWAKHFRIRVRRGRGAQMPRRCTRGTPRLLILGTLPKVGATCPPGTGTSPSRVEGHYSRGHGLCRVKDGRFRGCQLAPFGNLQNTFLENVSPP